MSNVIVVLGPGLIGQAIARRVSVGQHILLADVREENTARAAETLGNAGYNVSVRDGRRGRSRRRARARRTGHESRPRHRVDPRGRRLPLPGLTGDGPESRPVRHRAGARRVRQRHRPGRLGRRDLLAVRTPAAGAYRRAGQGARHDAGGTCSACRSSSPTKCRTRFTPTSSPSAATPCGSRPRRSGGAGAAPGSTRSAPASSSPHWPRTSSAGPAAKATGA